MNMKIFFMLLLLCTLIMNSKSYSQDAFPVLEGPYLGQEPPGLTPKVFAPGIVSTEHRDMAAFFTPNMKRLYFTRRDNKNNKWSLVCFQSENNRWSGSVVGPRPRLSRPMTTADGKTDWDSHYWQRARTAWSEIKNLWPSYQNYRVMRLTASSKGTYVFDVATKDGDGIIRFSRLTDGKREQPRAFGKEINTGKWNAHPFIAPDESYIMWDGERDSGFGANDIYISFLQRDGSWGAAINLGDKINTDSEDIGAYVTPDGKYFFFNRNEDIYWVDASFIETLRPN